MFEAIRAALKRFLGIRPKASLQQKLWALLFSKDETRPTYILFRK